MKISTRGRYGLKALVDLASQGDKYITIKSIAERLGISENYLERLIAQMKKAGFVKSVRGAQGGYSLNLPAEKITVGAVLRTLEGSLYPADCLSDIDSASCGESGCQNCVTKNVWEKIYASVNEVLDSITLMSLVEDYKNIETISKEN